MSKYSIKTRKIYCINKGFRADVPVQDNFTSMNMTDLFFLFGFFLVIFWAVDPFEWRLAYAAIVKHIPVITISPAFFLTIAASFLFPEKKTIVEHYNKYKITILILCFFGFYVSIGSFYARFFKGIENGFLTMGLYTFTAPLTFWYLRKCENPVFLIKIMVSTYFFFSLIALLMQMVNINKVGYFHEREHLVISVLILIYYLAHSNIVRFLGIMLILSAALITRKNTAYLIMLMAVTYISIVWAIQHALTIKNSFSRWVFWFKNILTAVAFGLIITSLYFFSKSSLPTGNPEYRLHTYEIAWNKFLSSPVWGTVFTGAATEKFNLFAVSTSTQILPTHSDPLDVLAQGGLIGFFAWIAIPLILLRLWLFFILEPSKQLEFAFIPYLHTLFFLVFSGYAVCTFNPLLNNPSLAWSFWGAVGALLVLLGAQQKKASNSLAINLGE